MRKVLFFTIILVLIVFLKLNVTVAQKEMKSGGKNMQSIYNFTVNDIDGKPVKLSQFKGKLMLIVNVASKCGFTPQYEGLQKLYSEYADKGLVILGFPANNFGGQEPGTNPEIKEFCTTKYSVTFPMFSKISVKGTDIHPLYQYLTSKETDPDFAGDITWNFNKFLIDTSGKIVARFDSKDKPESEKVLSAIQLALK
ncbi:MAG: glutathione peroxidase [Calditrichota bacterium]|jgi:glutathione peroxidase